jgi:hypothetical protein
VLVIKRFVPLCATAVHRPLPYATAYQLPAGTLCDDVHETVVAFAVNTFNWRKVQIDATSTMPAINKRFIFFIESRDSTVVPLIKNKLIALLRLSAI